MNRILVIALLALTVVSAQDACQLSLFAALPTLQPLYSNYKSRNWVAFESGMEKFMSSAQFIVENCLGSTILSSPGTQQCLKDTYVLARLAAPLAMQLNDSAALTNLVNNFNTAVTNAYKSCVKGDQDFLALYETEFPDLTNRQVPVKTNLKDFFGCVQEIYTITPLLITFIEDVRSNKTYEVISEDLKAIFANTDKLCDDCGIPKPSGGGGEVDIQKFLLSATKLSDDINLILNGDFISKAEGMYAFITDAPQTLIDCGITGTMRG